MGKSVLLVWLNGALQLRLERVEDVSTQLTTARPSGNPYPASTRMFTPCCSALLHFEQASTTERG